MGLTELLLPLLLGLLWFRSARLCAGEKQQCIHTVAMFGWESVFYSSVLSTLLGGKRGCLQEIQAVKKTQ